MQTGGGKLLAGSPLAQQKYGAVDRRNPRQPFLKSQESF
jgi:hypothetical protein